MSILVNIQSLCRKNGISVPKLEKILGFGNGSIYNWDKSSPSIDKLQKVAEYFKVSTDYLIYGFHRGWLASGLRIIRSERPFTQFVQDTGIDENELHELCAGTATKQPSIMTIAKIMTDNNLNVPPNNEIFEAAGYDSDQTPMPPFVIKTPTIHKDESQIAKDIEIMINNLDNKNNIVTPDDSDDNKDMELLKYSLLTSMLLAKQIAKRKMLQNKYDKE